MGTGMKRWAVALAAMTVAWLSVWTWIGVEIIAREHHSESQYFVKTAPSWQWQYHNPLLCGECDAVPLSRLDAQELRQFQRLCLDRYGISSASASADLFQSHPAP